MVVLKSRYQSFAHSKQSSHMEYIWLELKWFTQLGYHNSHSLFLYSLDKIFFLWMKMKRMSNQQSVYSYPSKKILVIRRLLSLADALRGLEIKSQLKQRRRKCTNCACPGSTSDHLFNSWCKKNSFFFKFESLNCSRWTHYFVTSTKHSEFQVSCNFAFQSILSCVIQFNPIMH